MPAGIKWKKEDIVDAIKKAWKEGADLRHSKVSKSDIYWAYKSHKNYFTDWHEALEAAGITYKQVTDRIKVPEKQDAQKKFLEELVTAFKSGLDLSASALQVPKTYGLSIYERHKRFYKGRFSWENALTEAGLPLEDIVKQKRWDKSLVKQNLLELKEKEVNLKPANIKENYASLYKAIINHFDNYKSALKYAGIKSTKILSNAQKRTKKSIILYIIKLHAEGKNLNKTHLLKGTKNIPKRNIYSAERKFEGGWEEAVNIAGINYDDYKQIKNNWTVDKIISEIKTMREMGEPLNSGNITKTKNGLYKAALRYAGGWKQALEKAGFDPLDIQLTKNIEENEILEKIKELHSSGSELNAGNILDSDSAEIRRIYYAATRKFKQGWDEALTLAGLDPEKIRKRANKYNINELKKEFKKAEKNGMDLTIKALSGKFKNYLRAINRRFDSYRDFLNAAGIDASKYTVGTWQNGQGVIDYLRENFPTGVVIGATADRNFAAAQSKYFGTIENAVKQAGLIYSRKGKISEKTLEAPENIGAIYKYNKDYLNEIAEEIYYKVPWKQRARVEKADIASQAFMKFLEILPKKPADKGIREFTYPILTKELSKELRAQMKEIRYEKDVYFDLFREKTDDYDTEDYYADNIDSKMSQEMALDDIVDEEESNYNYSAYT